MQHILLWKIPIFLLQSGNPLSSGFSDEESSSPSIAVIIGGVLGGVVGIGTIAGVVSYILLRKSSTTVKPLSGVPEK